jgi:hypothetical protein
MWWKQDCILFTFPFHECPGLRRLVGTYVCATRIIVSHFLVYNTVGCLCAFPLCFFLHLTIANIVLIIFVYCIPVRRGKINSYSYYSYTGTGGNAMVPYCKKWKKSHYFHLVGCWVIRIRINFMRIRIQLFKWMRIQIKLCKWMRIQRIRIYVVRKKQQNFQWQVKC